MSMYHLHVPRTSGTYVKNNVLPHLITGGVEHFASNRSQIDLEQIKNSKFVIGHFGLMPIDYMTDVDVFCILRDPVERFISDFKYTSKITERNGTAEEKLNHLLYENQSDLQSNIQSKFLSGRINVDKFNLDPARYIHSSRNGWFIENYSKDINVIKRNIDKINCYTMDNHSRFKSDFNKSLNKNFGFTTFKHDDKANQSQDVGISLTKSQISRIEDLNRLDMEVYEYVRQTQKR